MKLFMIKIEPLCAKYCPITGPPHFKTFFIYQDRRLKFIAKNYSYKQKYNDMIMCELPLLSRNIYASIVHFRKVQ